MKAKLLGWLEVGLAFALSLVLAVSIAGAGLAVLVLVIDLIANQASIQQVVAASTLERLFVVALGAALFAGVLLRVAPRWRDSPILPAVGAAVPVIAALLIGEVLWWSSFRSLLGHRGESPTTFLGAWGPIVGLALVAGLIVWLVLRASLAIIAKDHDRPRWLVPLALGALFAGGLVLLLQAPPKTPEVLSRDQQLDATGVHGAPDLSYDIVLVVNPRDAAGRRLIALSASRPEEIALPRTDAVRWNTRYGLAVVGRRPADYRLLLEPTADRAALAAQLGSLRAAAGRPVPANYDRALPDLLGNRIPARDKTQRAVAVLAHDAPARLSRAAVRAIAPPHPVDPGKPLTAGAITLNLVTDGGAKPAIKRWGRWTSRTGGALSIHHGAATALADAEDAVVGAPSPLDQRLAFRYRPVVLLDTAEKERPIDVDAFLAERGDNHQPAHQLCTASGPGYTGCTDVTTGLDLKPDVTDRDGVLRLEGNKPSVPPVLPDRIYYHPGLSQDRTRLYLDYWIFYSFNDAPNFAGFTCLSGISIPDLTCFDHEGDWEGMTVTLARQGAGFRPESVTYSGHSWRYRFTWRTLQRFGAITPAGHPRVWVAQGSHASYPGPCGRTAGGVSCHQLNSDVPDGRRDGLKPWLYNSDALCRSESCVLALPQTRWGGPASWDAFGGHWGMPRCAVGTQLCVRSLGPSSPYFQNRYWHPGIASVDDPLLPLR